MDPAVVPLRSDLDTEVKGEAAIINIA